MLFGVFCVGLKCLGVFLSGLVGFLVVLSGFFVFCVGFGWFLSGSGVFCVVFERFPCALCWFWCVFCCF